MQLPLLSQRCEAPGCRTGIQITHPYCPAHLKQLAKCSVGRSSLGGFGLFADSVDQHVFKPGDHIINFVGELKTAAELQERYHCSHFIYVIQFNANLFLDGSLLRAAAFCANHSAKKANCRIVLDTQKKIARLVATAHIYRHQEILYNYGPQYGTRFQEGNLTHKTEFVRHNVNEQLFQFLPEAYESDAWLPGLSLRDKIRLTNESEPMSASLAQMLLKLLSKRHPRLSETGSFQSILTGLSAVQKYSQISVTPALQNIQVFLDPSRKHFSGFVYQDGHLVLIDTVFDSPSQLGCQRVMELYGPRVQVERLKLKKQPSNFECGWNVFFYLWALLEIPLELGRLPKLKRQIRQFKKFLYDQILQSQENASSESHFNFSFSRREKRSLRAITSPVAVPLDGLRFGRRAPS